MSTDFDALTDVQKLELADLVISQMASNQKVPFKPVDMNNLSYLDDSDAEWVQNIAQLEPGHPVSAGAPDPENNKGLVNWGLRDLARRTAYLFKRIVPVGAALPFTCDTPPDGWLELAGTAHSRTSYADLWAHAQTSGMYDPTGAEVTMFGPGDGATTFTIPDVRADVLRAWDNGRGIDLGRGLGTFQDFAIENITGSWTSRANNISSPIDARSNINAATGAMDSDRVGGAAGSVTWAGGGYMQDVTTFDASRVVQTAAETRARNTAFMFCIKY